MGESLSASHIRGFQSTIHFVSGSLYSMQKSDLLMAFRVTLNLLERIGELMGGPGGERMGNSNATPTLTNKSVNSIGSMKQNIRSTNNPPRGVGNTPNSVQRKFSTPTSFQGSLNTSTRGPFIASYKGFNSPATSTITNGVSGLTPATSINTADRIPSGKTPGGPPPMLSCPTKVNNCGLGPTRNQSIDPMSVPSPIPYLQPSTSRKKNALEDVKNPGVNEQPRKTGDIQVLDLTCTGSDDEDVDKKDPQGPTWGPKVARESLNSNQLEQLSQFADDHEVEERRVLLNKLLAESERIQEDLSVKYECPFCSKIYTIKESIRYHIKVVHLQWHLRDNNVICEKCGRRFTCPRNAKQHALRCQLDPSFEKTEGPSPSLSIETVVKTPEVSHPDVLT